ncbi:MAG TPA: hypothetical protein VH085_00990 [Nocardioides sp.]|nr:hypothetical protein [Nocardioides sp.]
MYGEIDPNRPRWYGEPSATRRTWMRAAANAAWSAPLVSVAAAAPAHAATSTANGTGLAFVSATFYLWSLGSSTCVDPVITVTNPTSRAASPIWIDLQFATSDFVGANTFLDPPTPSYVDLPIPSSDGSWTVETLGHSSGDTIVTVRLRRAKGLAAGETSTVGGAVNKYVPFGIIFANNPTATSVPVVLGTSTAGFPVTPGTLSRIPQPT